MGLVAQLPVPFDSWASRVWFRSLGFQSKKRSAPSILPP